MNQLIRNLIAEAEKAAGSRDIADMDTDHLWMFLTGLRGPDVDAPEAEDIKWRTTAVLRSATLPMLAFRAGADVNRHGRFEIRPGDREIVGAHFIQHVAFAAEALGLITREQREAAMFPIPTLKPIIGKTANEVFTSLHNQPTNS